MSGERFVDAEDVLFWMMGWLLSWSLAPMPENPSDVIVFATPADRPVDEHAMSVRAAAARLQGSGLELRAYVLPTDTPAIVWAQRHASRPEVVGVFWYRIAPSGEASLWVLAPGWTEPRRRDIPAVQTTSSAATLESIGLIVRSTAIALRERGEPSGITELPPSPEEPPVEATRWGGDGRLPVAVSYVGETFAREVPWQSSVSAELGWRPHPLLVLGVAYRFAIPRWVSGGAQIHRGIRTWRHPIELHVGARGRFTKLFAMEFEMLGAVEPLRAEVRAADPSLDLLEPRWRTMFAIGPRVRAHFIVWRALSLHLELGIVFALRRFDYVIDDGTGLDTVLSPSAVRARAGIGLGYAFF